MQKPIDYFCCALAGQQAFDVLAQALAEQLRPDAEGAGALPKALLRANTDEASARGVFGVPAFEVDGRLFWGFDTGSP